MEQLRAGAVRLGLSLSDASLATLRQYAELLLARNQVMNLTGASTLDELEIRHLLDSLTVAKYLPGAGASVIDVGSGGGFPGIPLAIIRPDVQIALLESAIKKATFLQEAVNELHLGNVIIINQRAELAGQSWEYRQRFHLAVTRAVAAAPVALELTLPFVRLLGRAVLMKKGNIDVELEQARRALRQLGGTIELVDTLPLPDLLPEHMLVVVEKLQATQARFPRRPGIPERRPLV